MTQQPTVIKLQQPILFGSESIKELTLQPPKAKHYRGMPADMGMDEMLTLAGRLSGQPNTVIDELSIDDMQTVMENISHFLANGPPTGKTS